MFDSKPANQMQPLGGWQLVWLRFYFLLLPQQTLVLEVAVEVCAVLEEEQAFSVLHLGSPSSAACSLLVLLVACSELPLLP